MKRIGTFLIAVSVAALAALFFLVSPQPADAEELPEYVDALPEATCKPAYVIPADADLCIVIIIQRLE